MKKNGFRLLCALLGAILLSGSCLAAESPTPAVVETAVSVSAESYCLMDGETGRILSSSHADARLPIASTTKILTCLVALDACDPDAMVTITKEAVGIEGSSMYLYAGEKLTLRDLLYGLMLESANDAAVAIALAVSGSIEGFAELMNQKAQQLGMKNSHFVNPNGLSDEGHYSSAYDLSLLMKAGLQNQTFAEIVQTKSCEIKYREGKTQLLSNHNRLLRTLASCIGGKTGYTILAGRCLVSAARQDGKTLICTTLNDRNDWADHKELYEYGFSLYENKVIAAKGELVRTLPVVGGEKSEVAVCNLEEVVLPVFASQEVEMRYELPAFLYAPVAVSAGEPVGECILSQDGVELARCPLFAAEEVAYHHTLSFWERLWQTIKSWF